MKELAKKKKKDLFVVDCGDTHDGKDMAVIMLKLWLTTTRNDKVLDSVMLLSPMVFYRNPCWKTSHMMFWLLVCCLWRMMMHVIMAVTYSLYIGNHELYGNLQYAWFNLSWFSHVLLLWHVFSEWGHWRCLQEFHATLEWPLPCIKCLL